MVLRLVRLTRMLRTPKLAEPAFVIYQTMIQSTKALYLLAFNAVLGILIFGSLMYLVDKGDWDHETRTYNRYVSESWNATSRTYDANTAESPFLSIPHAFWWAITTTTTVGYGDFFPTTSEGYIVATIYMVFGVVIGALPVGIIGGNFSDVWVQYALDKRASIEQTEKDKRFITAAIQRIDPFEMSRLIYVEVWNERFPESERFDRSGRNLSTRPDIAEFIGQAHAVVEMPSDRSTSETRILKLQEGAEGKLHRREVSGSITIQYEWTPPEEAFTSGDVDKLNGQTVPGESPRSSGYLRGKLKVTVVSADNLTNLTYSNGKRAGSNPYCRVFCYPHSPCNGRTVCPSAWRMPLDVGTLSPKWNASHVFNFSWVSPKERLSLECAPNQDKSALTKVQESGTTGSAGTFAKSLLSKKSGASALVQSLSQELKCLSDELRALNDRATRFSLTPEPPAERMD